MSFFDNILKKMKMVPEDDEYDDYDDVEEEEEREEKPKKSLKRRSEPVEESFDDDEPEEENVYQNPGRPSRQESLRPADSYRERENVRVLNVSKAGSRSGSSEVCMIMPRSFDDATTIADMLLNYKAVVLNMEGIDMAAAQRLIDFASGACYTVGGNLQKISRKIFLIVPQSMNLSGDFDELVGDMVDLNSMNSAK